MNGDSQPTNAELLQAIVALHASTEAGLQRLDSRIDRLDGKFERFDSKFHSKVEGLDNKIERLRYDTIRYRRFDHVDMELDEVKGRVTRLELRPF